MYMRNHKKPLRFYLGIFAFSAIIIFGYSLYAILTEKATASDLYSLWFMPLVFTGVYYGTDVIMDKVGRKRKKNDYEAEFLMAVSKKMQEDNTFLVEDYRRLQINPRFQEVLRIAYQVYQNGENEQFTLARIEKKFRPETIEYKATNVVIELVREKLGNNAL